MRTGELESSEVKPKFMLTASRNFLTLSQRRPASALTHPAQDSQEQQDGAEASTKDEEIVQHCVKQTKDCQNSWFGTLNDIP